MIIDTTSYRKDTAHPVRWGYQARGNGVPSSVVIHTTSNRRPTRFETEAEFLQHSADVSAHFLIGKDGRIVQFLDPVRWQAWHAGTALPAFLNAKSVGIEHHVSLGEPWTAVMHEACTWLVRTLMEAHGIPAERVDTHRAVALPSGRKRDPEGWDSPSFYTWRSTLAAPPAPVAYVPYVLLSPCTPFTDRSPSAPLASVVLQAGAVVNMGDKRDGWLWISDRADTPPGIGFIPESYARPL